jgi:hypothetical protein
MVNKQYDDHHRSLDRLMIVLKLGAIFVTIYASSLLILIPFTLYFSLTLYLQRFYMKASRDLYRLGNYTYIGFRKY